MKEWLYKVVSGTSAKHLRHIGGIWVGEGVYDSRTRYNMTLIRHEYGHWLQYKDKGAVYYYGVIAPASVYFAARRNNYGWTELDANNRAYNYFGKPSWWYHSLFPFKK